MIASSSTLDSPTSEAQQAAPVVVADLPTHLTRTVAADAARPPVVSPNRIRLARQLLRRRHPGLIGHPQPESRGTRSPAR
ncbi:hypothetical protein [Micromonospora polyrhachis]|uniref:Uncharacterized protein n=1 Tax=Micromonospora polyrhachis TaxID=1282883 RepID=A0A7W7WRI3_9ACTN|nr:hypothetical protein [Micromonospora polyrhachis]MBB4960333.1 hypothetical protein [Micromonospora polyrhachis]